MRRCQNSRISEGQEHFANAVAQLFIVLRTARIGERRLFRLRRREFGLRVGRETRELGLHRPCEARARRVRHRNSRHVSSRLAARRARKLSLQLCSHRSQLRLRAAPRRTEVLQQRHPVLSAEVYELHRLHTGGEVDAYKYDKQQKRLWYILGILH